jgi:hypothetical protein
MTAWVRTADGWALNLDGSDASRVFSLPRLEVRSSAEGWHSRCLMPDGTMRERPEGAAASVTAAKAGALSQAARMLGLADAAALASLLAASR